VGAEEAVAAFWVPDWATELAVVNVLSACAVDAVLAAACATLVVTAVVRAATAWADDARWKAGAGKLKVGTTAAAFGVEVAVAADRRAIAEVGGENCGGAPTVPREAGPDSSCWSAALRPSSSGFTPLRRRESSQARRTSASVVEPHGSSSPGSSISWWYACCCPTGVRGNADLRGIAPPVECR